MHDFDFNELLSLVMIPNYQQNELFSLFHIMFILVEIMLNSPLETLIDWPGNRLE